MSKGESWTKDLFIIGAISLGSYGLYQYLTSTNEPILEMENEKKETKQKEIVKMEEKPEEIELSFIEKWVLYSNLKELEKYSEILVLTEDSKDLISLTFKGEALESLNEPKESEKLFKFIIEQNPKSDDDLYSIGKAYEQLQNYEKAIEIFESLRSKEHPFAHYSLGIYLQRGVIFEKNQQKAIEYFKTSANLNNPASQYILSLLLKKSEESIEYLKKSADFNYLPALITFGDLLSNRKDFISAFHYYMKAAMEGNSKAQFEIANFYSNGDGVEKDFDEAFQWCKKSAENEYTPAEYLLGGFYHIGSGCEKNLSSAFEFYNRAAEKGNPSAQYSNI